MSTDLTSREQGRDVGCRLSVSEVQLLGNSLHLQPSVYDTSGLA